jgi:ATP/maltotriose-dependent transcriptional regulator MalT
MQQPDLIRPKPIDTWADESVFKTPRIALLKQEHWSYIKRHYDMSRREVQVAELICMGFSNEEVAKDLKIRPGTVKTHLRNIYRRIRVNNKITMLLKVVDQATKYSAMSGIKPPAPIIQIKNPAINNPSWTQINK